MKCLPTVVVAATLSITSVFAAAVPSVVSTDVDAHEANTTRHDVNPYVFGNLSSLFGWQMAGATASEDQTAAACSDVSSLGHGKWAAMGLDPENIKAPLCNSSHSNPRPIDSITHIIYYSSNIFIDQLLGSFHAPDALEYLCNNVKFDLLDAFLLNDTAILGTVCHSVGNQLPPRPFGPDHGGLPNRAPALAIRNSASVLYAFILAAGATDDSELSLLCAHAPEYVSNLDSALMNGTAFRETLCAIKKPISVKEAVAGVTEWLTRIFITMVESVSNVGDWLGWLCEHVVVEGMDGVGLDGVVVNQTICRDSVAGKAS